MYCNYCNFFHYCYYCTSASIILMIEINVHYCILLQLIVWFIDAIIMISIIAIFAIIMIIWIVADADIGVFTDIGSRSNPMSCHMSRYRVFRVTRYRVMSDETRYRVTLTPILTPWPILGATRYRVIMSDSPTSFTVYPIWGSISGPISGYPISGPARLHFPISVSISDTISGVPISGFNNLRYRHQYRTLYRASNCQCAPPGMRSSWP